MRVNVLDINKMDTVEAAHSYFKELFDFPDFYGNNWDALFDCLTDIPKEMVIIMPKEQQLIDKLNDQGKVMIKVFEDASISNKNLHVIMNKLLIK